MTSNLGAAEMSAVLAPKLGFGAAERARQSACRVDEKLHSKVSRSGIEAARRKFTPEFMNRLDKIVTFNSLGSEELKRILDIELDGVQQRIFGASSAHGFAFTATSAAKEFILQEGTDVKYGARHLKRAIERLVVQPLSNLIATEQVRAGDWIEVDHDHTSPQMTFRKEAEALAPYAMADLLDRSGVRPALAVPAAVIAQSAKTQSASFFRRG
jgi:ATP-dependent Clp protease ATP-binding subunit ClpA